MDHMPVRARVIWRTDEDTKLGRFSAEIQRRRYNEKEELKRGETYICISYEVKEGVERV